MQLIDSHCHLNFIAFHNDSHKIAEDFLKTNYALINVGAQVTSSARAIKLAEEFEKGLYAAVGLHPIHLVEDAEETLIIDGKSQAFKIVKEEFNYEKYRDLAENNKVVAIGEVGLDYYYLDKYSPAEQTEFKTLQVEVFRQFIKMAEELDKPLILHCRGNKQDNFSAYGDILDILKKEIKAGRKIRGVLHCFGGNQRQAEEFLDLGFYLGFTGIITFGKKAEELQEIAKAVPLEKVLIETDAPYLSPEPYRGQRNMPQYVRLVAQKIADLKKISLEEVASATTQNAKDLFLI